MKRLLPIVMTLAACREADSKRYDYYPLIMHDSVMVRGCDGYALGTVRVDRDDGTTTTCIPLKRGCDDARDAGCGEGRFGSNAVPLK